MAVVLPSPRDIVSELRSPLRRRHIQKADQLRVMQGMRDSGAIFVHVPKTGGKSIASELYRTDLHEGFGHATALFYRDLFGALSYRRFFSFAFVRNPWDRAYSAYRFARAGGFGFAKGLELQKTIGDKDFNAFVRDWLGTENLSPYVIFRPQHEFLCDSRGNVLIKRVCQFERFDEEYAALGEHLRLGKAPRRMNASESGADYKAIYDDSSRRVIERLYAKDIALFGYSFDGL